MNRILALATLLFAFPAQAVVSVDWVTVGGAGNSCDTQSQGCYGGIATLCSLLGLAGFAVRPSRHVSLKALF